MTPRRDMQMSLIEGIPERPASAIPPSVIAGDNATLIERIAPLYLHGTPVVDLTYGQGGWWRRWKPAELVAHDLHTVDGVDFTDLPEPDETYAAATFDPPYIPAGGTGTTAAARVFRTRFGLSTGRNDNDIADLLAQGMSEAVRVTRTGGYVLVKCADYVNGGRLRAGLAPVFTAAVELPVEIHDVIVHHSNGGPGSHMSGEIIRRTRRAHSYLIVLRKLRT